MGINVENYKVIYNDVVYNPLNINPIFGEYKDNEKFQKIKFIQMIFINEDGNLVSVEDEAWMFKFVRRLNEYFKGDERMKESDKIHRIKSLVYRLNVFRDEYYNNSKSIVPDCEYDRFFDELATLEKETGIIMSNSPTQTVGYEVKSKLEKVSHSHPIDRKSVV